MPADLGIFLAAKQAQAQRAAAVHALMARAGLRERNPDNEYGDIALSGLAADALDRAGVSTVGLTQVELIGRAFAHSSSDFPLLLVDTLQAAALRGYDESPEVFQRYTQVGTLSDFRATTRVGLGAFPNLPRVPEGAAISYATLGDTSAAVALASYASLFRVTRQAVSNDHVGELLAIPRKAGRAARRTIGALVADVLSGNPTMADGEALFSAPHANIGTPGAISTSTVDQLCGLIADQTSNGVRLGLQARFLIVPAQLQGLARNIVSAQYSVTPAGTFATDQPNPLLGRLEVVVDPHLEGAAYFVCADPLVTDVIEVSYLNGRQEPRTESIRKFDSDGGAVRVALDVAVAPLDFRGLAMNAGA